MSNTPKCDIENIVDNMREDVRQITVEIQRLQADSNGTWVNKAGFVYNVNTKITQSL